MIITVDMLAVVGVKPTQATAFLDSLNAACAAYDISTRPQLASFLAQCSVESIGLTHLEEDLYYSTPERIRQIFPRQVPSLDVAATLARNPQALANRVYAGRLGNGDEASGDGWRYRGRGVLQTTGRQHYEDAANGVGRPYLDQPDLLAQPSDACLAAAWYWNDNNLNAVADAARWDDITKAINGPGMEQAAYRTQLTLEALQQWA